MAVGNYYVGVDVGTGSVRAALVDDSGKIVHISQSPITTFNPTADFYHQSSNNIWLQCCKVVREVTGSIPKESVKGIAFDATCSLVALDKQGEPLSVSPSGEREQNIILWLDHRAEAEASLINKTQHKLLSYVGGKMSLEMQLPKLLWLKKNLKEDCWNKAGFFFDLADFLSWKATGSNCRSLCTVTCKWAFDAGANAWDKSFMESIDLDDLLIDNCNKIGLVMQSPGSPCGRGLTEQAAGELGGLVPGTAVASSIIDAHAGVLGLVGATTTTSHHVQAATALESRLSVICGTSTCLMALSPTAVFVDGVWGPYANVLGLGLWLNEGGQSATGKLLDHVINSHPATPTINAKLPHNVHIMEYLNGLLVRMAEKRNLSSVDYLTKDLHIWPDFHGNRSPLADPTLRGMMSGISLSTTEEDLALCYLAVMQSLAYSTKHIVGSMERAGHAGIKSVLMCGGLANNSMFVRVHASVLACAVLVPSEEHNAMLRGTAMLAARAALAYPSLRQAMASMSGQATTVQPDSATFQYHSKKYQVFLQMVEDQKKYKRMME